MVDKAATTVKNKPAISVQVDSRPMNSAKVVSVPYSASNLSSRGVNAATLMIAWRKPACIRGKVFVRYTEVDDMSADV